MTANYFPRRKLALFLLFSCAIFLYWRAGRPLLPAPSPASHSPAPPAEENHPQPNDQEPSLSPIFDNVDSHWARVPQRYPVSSLIPMPSSVPGRVPRIQHHFSAESIEARRVRLSRLEAVKENFTHSWQGYKTHAWMSDEVRPLSGGAHNPFGGWAATLVDTLDILWIMGFHDDFEEAVQAAAKIDFSHCTLEELNVFETTIRYLGGFLAAYDVSDGKYPVLLQKAVELGQMLYVAFDTPNRMPITRWKFAAAAKGEPQEAGDMVLSAEIGSLTLEFTRLSQLTGDPRYFDAVQRIMDVFDAQQNDSKLPGMWPLVVNAKDLKFAEYTWFTLGGMADSLYEYLPKQHVLLGGSTEQYRKLYNDAIVPIKAHIFYRPMTQGALDVLFTGKVSSNGRESLSKLKTEAEAQHLACFAGGMVALGAKAFDNADELDVARKLVDGCLWAYETGHLGIMPEIMHTVPCEDRYNCPWDPMKWQEAVDLAFPDDKRSANEKIREKHLPPGVAKVDDARYILRPEAIESVFILYRITGDPSLADRAWNMFQSIVKVATTDIAHAGINDCTVDNPLKSDRMESFWLAETLKYFYLIFSEPDVISLDEYVFNTEAHPFRWA